MGITLDSLDSALHSVEIKNAAGQAILIDGSGFLTSKISGTVEIVDGGNSITVDGTVASTQSGVWNIGTVASITADVNVTATDLDIRALTNVDVVTIEDGGNSITVDGTLASTQSGVWDIGTLGTITNVVHIDDNAGSLTVDATALDIRPLTNADVVTVEGAISTTPESFDSWQVQVNAAVGSTAVELAATPLALRLNAIVENLGAQDIFIGPDNTVTTSTGLKLPKGSSLEVNFGVDANVWAITASGTSDVRVAEFAA